MKCGAMLGREVQRGAVRYTRYNTVFSEVCELVLVVMCSDLSWFSIIEI